MNWNSKAKGIFQNKRIIKIQENIEHTSVIHKTMTIKLISKFYYVISVFKVDVSSWKRYGTKAANRLLKIISNLLTRYTYR